MSILLLGANGQVGTALRASLSSSGSVIACSRAEADLEDPLELRGVLDTIKPSVVINAAAYTAVDQAEDEPERARSINADAVDLIAQHVAKTGAILVHYSTDYVFDGTKDGPYTESDATNPMSVYGQTKLDGERAIQASGCRALVFRTSWVYSAQGNNFINTIRRIAREHEQLSIVNDQIGAPTSATLIADVTKRAIECVNNETVTDHDLGLYHLVASGSTSWFGFAEHFLGKDREAGHNVAEINPIPTSAYPSKAHRPLNSRLDSSRIRSVFGVELPDWTRHVDAMIATMRPQETL
jgi:dTDP-4-dehydrorhamnose reductase